MVLSLVEVTANRLLKPELDGLNVLVALRHTDWSVCSSYTISKARQR